jgi:hypothetical protein
MKRFILTVAAVAFTTVICGGTINQAEAKPGKFISKGPSVKIIIGSPGHHYRGSYYLRDYDGFTTRCWFPQYQCYGYYCPADGAWYYWYEPMGRYQPVTLLSAYPPPLAAPIAPVTGTPALPPGAVPPPVQTPSPASMSEPMQSQ